MPRKIWNSAAVQLELRKQQPFHKIMNHQNGFTLIELLLVVLVLMIFMASAVFYMSPALRGVQLEEGAARFESMFRFASAEATQTGQRVLVRFISTNDFSGREGYVPQVLVEKDPTGNPGSFSELQNVSWLNLGIGELVSVISITHLNGDGSASKQKEEEMSDQFWDYSPPPEDTNSLSQTNGLKLAPLENYSAILGDVRDGESSSGEGTNDLGQGEETSLESSVRDSQDILFYPDGSSETVEVRLVSCDSEDRRTVVILLNGITGLVERKIYTPSALTDEEDLEETPPEEEEEADDLGEDLFDESLSPIPAPSP